MHQEKAAKQKANTSMSYWYVAVTLQSIFLPFEYLLYIYIYDIYSNQFFFSCLSVCFA